METAVMAGSPFLAFVAWSVVLLLVTIMLQGMTATKELGTEWNAGPRDGANKPTGKYAGRAARASQNFRETYPAFVGLALACAIAGVTGGIGLIGAWVWFICRIVYIPLYLGGVPYIRSLVWLGSIAGLAMMAAGIFF